MKDKKKHEEKPEQLHENEDTVDTTEPSDFSSCCCGGDEMPNGLDTLNEKIKELEDKLLRQAADSENYRKRLLRECDDKVKYANQSLLSGFLPVMDNFDLALLHATPESDLNSIIEGIKLTQKSLLDNLAKSGITEIKTEVGDTFDPAIHEALTLCNNADMPNNSITMILQKGYKLGDRVIRATKVQVNKC